MSEQASRLKVRVLQIAYADSEDLASRLERVAALVREQAGADLVVLPELWAHGAFTFANWSEDAQLLGGPIVTELAAAARAAGVWLHGGSIVERADIGASRGTQQRGLWNTAILFDPAGALSATYRKIHRFGFGVGEPALLEAGVDIVTTPLSHGVTAGLATCYDLRFPELFRRLLDAGAGLFIVPAAWPQARVEQWSLLGRARALENQAYVIQCNTAGTHGGVVMGGRSQIVGPDGVVLAEAPGGTQAVMSVELDLGRVATVREQFPVLRDRRL